MWRDINRGRRTYMNREVNGIERGGKRRNCVIIIDVSTSRKHLLGRK